MRRKLQLAILVTTSALIFLGCQSAAEETKPVDTEKLRTEIQALEDGFAAAEKAKDAAAVAAYYSDDAISYGRNEEPVKGRAAIKDKIADRLAKDTSGNYNVYKVVDLFPEGNSLVEVGAWTVHNPAGDELDRGHYISYFKKRDGKYVCVRDMSASSTPTKKP